MSPAVDGKVKTEGEIFFYDRFWEEIEKVGKETLSSLLNRKLDILEERLGEKIESEEELGWHQFKEYDLGKARTNQRIADFPEDGDCILVLYIDGAAEIKLTRGTADSFDLAIYKKIRHHFEDLYLTNTAQSGLKLKLLIGKGDWQIEDTYPEIDLTGEIRNDLLKQITNPDKIGQIIKNSHVIPHADILCEKILLSETTRLDQWRSEEDYTYMDPGRILLHSTTKLSDWQHPSDLTLIAGGQIFAHSIEADKLNIVRHIVNGAVWANNDPVAGKVAWAGAKVTYNGATYTITNGNTDKAYIWWDFSLSKTTFQTSDTKPTLADDDFIVAFNDSGTHILIWNATVIDGRVLRTGTLIASDIIVLGDTTLADWRHGSDLTMIDGGDIYTHSIQANRLSILRHILSGATWTNNSPVAGKVAWAGAKVTYNGATYTITNGNTDKAYIWWDFSLSKTTFQVSDTQPTLTDDDLLVAYNNSGIHILVWNSTLVDGRNIRTGTIHADAYYELRNTYVFSDQDSLDATYPLEMLFEIVSEMTAIVNIKLSFKIRNFRAYATGVPSGGGHTTPSGGGHTTPSGGGATSGAKGTPSGGGATSGAGGATTPTSSSETHYHDGTTAINGADHTHGIRIYHSTSTYDNVVADSGGPRFVFNHSQIDIPTLGCGSGANHNHSYQTGASGAHTHTVTIKNHTHTTPDHTHPDHTHTTPAHTHTVSDHTHTVSDHEHSLTFGIYEDVQSPTITIKIDNGAGYGASIGSYDADQLDIDITGHISDVGLKQIKFESNLRTRIAAHILCKVDLTA